jgi:branched-chain amino acid aminotransferase
MEAINKYYLNNGTIYPIKEFTDEDSKEKIIYEVLRVVNGKPAFLKDHLERMKKSFKLINKEFPYDEDEIEKLIIEVIKKNDNALGNIKITCNVNNNNFKIYYIMHSYPSKEYYKKGVKVILYYGERENPNLKVVSTAFRAKIAIFSLAAQYPILQPVIAYDLDNPLITIVLSYASFERLAILI